MSNAVEIGSFKSETSTWPCLALQAGGHVGSGPIDIEGHCQPALSVAPALCFGWIFTLCLYMMRKGNGKRAVGRRPLHQGTGKHASLSTTEAATLSVANL